MGTGQDRTEAGRRGGSWLGALARLIGVLLVGIVVALGLVLIFPPTDLIRKELEKSATAAAGRPVSIGGLDLTIGSKIGVRLNDVAVSSPSGFGEPNLVKIEAAEGALAWAPLLSRIVDVSGVTLTKPSLTLATEAAGKNNWTFEPPAATTPSPIHGIIVTGATIKKGNLKVVAPNAKEPLELSDIEAAVSSDPASGKGAAKGTLVHRAEPVSFDVALDDVRKIVAGSASGLTAVVEGRLVKVAVAGSADPATRELSGDVTMSSPSVADLAGWLGGKPAAAESKVPLAVKGKVSAMAGGIGLGGADVELGAHKGKLDGRLDLTGDRPRYQGQIATARLDLDTLLAAPGASGRSEAAPAPEDGEDLVDFGTGPTWDGLLKAMKSLEPGGTPAETSGQPGAAEAERALPPAKPAWSDAPIELQILRLADLDATILADEVAYKKLELKSARLQAKLDNGLLDADLEDLGVGAGKAKGKLKIDASDSSPVADLQLDMKDVAAEPIVRLVTGKALLTGNSNVEINAKAAGKTLNQLTSSVNGKATFRLSKGSISGFDVRRCLSDVWTCLGSGLKFDLKRKTGFERLEAQYDIKNGIMKSSPGLDLGGSDIEVQSKKGEVSLPTKRLDQELKVKIVPPPSAPSFPVRIYGSWSKIDYDVDWQTILGLFFSFGRDARGASPEGEAEADFSGLPAPEAASVPADVRDTATRILESQKDKLSPEGVAFFRRLAPGAEPEPAAPQASEPAATEPAAAQPEATPAPAEGTPESAPAPVVP